jgi:hypothetical protein
MAQTDLQIKISVEAQLGQLRAMEAQIQRQIVQLRTLGDKGSASLKDLERNLGLVRAELGNIGQMDKISTALGDVLKNIPAVGAGMQALNGTALPVAAVFGAVTTAMHQFGAALSFADQLQDTAEQIDVTTTALQALNAHFADAGLKPAAVSQAILKLKQSLAEAVTTAGPARAAFEALGLDPFELRLRSTDQALAEVGAALAGHANQAQAAAAAQDILGRTTGRLINVLKALGVEGIDGITAKYTASGEVLEAAMVKQLADANQQLEKLDRRWTIFKANVAASLTTASGLANAAGNVLAPGATAAVKVVGGLADYAAAPSPEVARQRAAIAILAEQQRKADEDEARSREAASAKAEARRQTEFADNSKRIEVLAKKEDEAAALALATRTAQMPLADQLADAETRRAGLADRLQAADGLGIEAAERRAQLSLELAQAEAALAALRQRQAAEDTKAQADDEAWLERTYAAEVARLALRKKDREQDRDRALSRSLSGGDEQLARLDQSRTLLDADRDRQKLAILTRQKEEVAERIALLERELELSPSEDGRARLDALRSKQADIGAKTDGLAPRSLGDGAKEGLASTINQFGSDADIVARGVQASFSGVFDGLRGSIQGLIEGTMTWGDALRNIGSSILSGVISAISEMFATWIAKRILIHTLGLSFLAAEGAAETAKEAATLPAKTAGAAAAGISSYGLAIAGGLAAIALIASLSGGFAEGGAVSGPGTGTSDSIFARLSNGEHVMTAAAVQRVGGHGVLDAINAGRIPDLASGPASGSAAPAAAPAVSMSNHFHFDPNEAMRQALAEPAGRRLVTDLLRQIQYEI